MEAVNNYFTGSVRTVSWGPGNSGSGFGTASDGTGGIQFSSLMKDSNPVKANPDSGKKTSNPVNDRSGSDRNTNFGYDKTDKAESQVTKPLGQDTGKSEEEAEAPDANAEEMASMLALMNSLQADRITPVSDGTELQTDDIKGIEGLMADYITTASNGVELVTERISTTATPPSVDVSSLQSQSEQTSASAVTSESANATALEAERNGSEETAEKVVENPAVNKYDPEEILKSLEGQGRIVANSSNSPSGPASTDTNGPTGRDPGEKRNSEEIAKGPAVPKTEEKAETTETESAAKTTDPMEGFTEVQASTPMPFANQTNQTAKGTETQVSTSESMMMRTSEATMASDLTNLLSSRFPTQNGQLTIELDPENLGKITINVSYDSGHAAVSISATNQKTVEILTQNASAMANIIQQKTGQETQVFIPNTQESSPKQDMASGRESNENAAQQQAKQQEQQSRGSESASSAFLQQMRLGLV